MDKTFRFLVVAAAFFLSSLACRTFQTLTSSEPPVDGIQISQSPTPSLTLLPSPVSTPTSQILPTTAPLEPGLFFLDDFSDRNSGWAVQNTDTTVWDYYQEGYRILVSAPGTTTWSTISVNYADVRLVVDAKLIGGELDNFLGVVCRYQDGDNFYAAVISSDGFYAILRRLQGAGIEVISGEYFQESLVINQGMELNLIDVSCVGDMIKLTVNGQVLAEVTGIAIPSGDVGMIVRTLSAESTDILFDNFTFYLE